MIRTTLGCVFLTSAALTAEPAPALKPFQGTWVISDALLAGRDHLEDFEGMKLVITGGKYKIEFGENSDTGTITLDAAKSPKWITLTTRKDGPFKGRTLPGIYKFDGDKLTVCLNSEKMDRPTAFGAKELTPLMLLTFTREKQ